MTTTVHIDVSLKTMKDFDPTRQCFAVEVDAAVSHMKALKLVKYSVRGLGTLPANANVYVLLDGLGPIYTQLRRV